MFLSQSLQWSSVTNGYGFINVGEWDAVLQNHRRPGSFGRPVLSVQHRYAENILKRTWTQELIIGIWRPKHAET